MSERPAGEDPSVEVLLGQIADEFTQRLNRGEQPQVEEYALRYPQVATVLRQVLPALLLIRLPAGNASGLRPTLAADVSPGMPLGDFQIVREIGRGGMGVVYEAEQLSLGRRVALKVLPFAAALDAKQLQRFKNEAQAAAGLHHTNIVPVYAVGCERGVHYFAMQYIDGQTLASLIQELRHLAGRQTADASQAAGPAAELASEMASGRWAPRQPGSAVGQLTGPYPAPAEAPGAPAPETVPQAAAASTQRWATDPAYFRTVAQLGIQAAEALEHAHQLRVIHRDVKPANLLVDGRGHLWVTDFGLAHCQSQAGLTLTGDLVGTLRYMSPEQALAKRVPVDHRTDVYSLGATLYEFLTLRPAFAGKDRQELLRQIAFEEPVRPRRLDRKVPAELETIVLKALEKNPADRYGTAQELADDLERFLKDEPIRARRPTAVQRARKWSRRHKPVVAALVTGLLSMLVVAVVLAFWRQGRQAETERGVTAALVQAETLLDEGDRQREHPERWQATARLAQGAAEKAAELLAAGTARQGLADRVQRVRTAAAVAVTDSRLLVELDRLRLELAAVVNVKENRFDEAQAAPLFAKLLGDYGVNLAEPQQAAARVRDSQLRQALLAALEDWSRVTGDDEERRRLEQVLESAEPDPDPFRARWRAASRRKDGAALRRLADEPVVQALPATALVWLAVDLQAVQESTAAEQVLRAGLDRYPNNFWLNGDLGLLLCDRQPSRAEEGVRYLMVAVALRSDSAGAQYNLGVALANKGEVEGAIRCLRAACRIDPNYALAHYNLGNALRAKGRLDEAIDEYREAFRLKPEYPETHNNLGVALLDKGRLDEAIDEYRKALRLKPEYLEAHINLGNALKDKGRLDEAIDEYRKALRLKPDYPEAHNGLGNALKAKGKLDEAIAEYHKALYLKKDYPNAHYSLGGALAAQGKRDEAIAEYRKALRLKPDFPEAHTNLGSALRAKGRLDEAIDEYRKALQTRESFPQAYVAHSNLGNALGDKGQLDEAIDEYQKALRLKPDYPAAHSNLGTALRDKRRLDEAIAEYRRAVHLRPEYAEALCNLGRALQEQGKFQQGLQDLRRGHALGSKRQGWPYPSAAWVEGCEHMVELEGRLPDLLAGTTKPANPGQRIELARLCVYKHLNRAGVRFYEEAFASQPKLADDRGEAHPYDAACAAALAAAGEGKDADKLDSTERGRLRREALDWLRAELAQWIKQLEIGTPQALSLVQRTLALWQQDSVLASMRGEAALAKLPAEEQAGWRRLWTDVEQALGKARQQSSPPEKPASKP
jgi:tetratricopeptide (TPR) repeat protein